MRTAAALLLILIAAAGCRTKPAQPTPPPWTIYPPTQPGQPPPPPYGQVTIQGQVRNPVIPWTPDLTLARALVQADYFGQRDPQSIVIFRGGDAILVETRQLLGGVKDPPLLPGDVVELRR